MHGCGGGGTGFVPTGVPCLCQVLAEQSSWTQEGPWGRLSASPAPGALEWGTGPTFSFGNQNLPGFVPFPQSRGLSFLSLSFTSVQLLGPSRWELTVPLSDPLRQGTQRVQGPHRTKARVI